MRVKEGDWETIRLFPVSEVTGEIQLSFRSAGQIQLGSIQSG